MTVVGCPKVSRFVGEAVPKSLGSKGRAEKRPSHLMLPTVEGMARMQVIGIASEMPSVALVADPS